jgi:hypothetical protein
MLKKHSEKAEQTYFFYEITVSQHSTQIDTNLKAFSYKKKMFKAPSRSRP